VAGAPVMGRPAPDFPNTPLIPAQAGIQFSRMGCKAADRSATPFWFPTFVGTSGGRGSEVNSLDAGACHGPSRPGFPQHPAHSGAGRDPVFANGLQGYRPERDPVLVPDVRRDERRQG